MNAKMKYFEQYDEATNIEYNLKLLDESADDDDDDEYDFFKHRKTGEFRLPQVTNFANSVTNTYVIFFVISWWNVSARPRESFGTCF